MSIKRVLFFVQVAIFSAGYCLTCTHTSAQTYVYAQLQGSPVNTTGWNLTGSAVVTNVTGTGNSEILLCPAITGQSGGIFFNQSINLSNCVKWIAEFDFRIYDGNGADGLAFCFLDVPPSGFVAGAGLGIPGSANGLKVCFDPYPNCPPYSFANMPKLELRWGTGYNECWAQPTATNMNFVRSNSYNHAKIIYDNGNIYVYVNNVYLLYGFQQFNFTGYMGFTASTGALMDNHSIKNAVIYTEMPPSEAGNNRTICSGQTVQLGTSSTAGYLYNWIPASGLTSSTISNPYLTLSNNSTTTDLVQKYFVQTSFSYAPNCPSVDSVIITVKRQPTIQTSNATICQGQSYTLPWGAAVNSSGIYNDTLDGVAGCDSLIRSVNLVVQNSSTQSLNPVICVGQSYTLPWGTVVNSPGIYKDTLRYSITNCDSLVRVVNLTVQTSTTSTINGSLCQGQSYTLPWGTVVNTPGIYKDTLRYVNTNCDSVIRIVNVGQQNVATTTSSAIICQGQSYTLPWGVVVTSAGMYADTLKFSNNVCDSLIRTVNLIVQTASIQTTNPTICAGQTYTLPWGQSVNTTGNYRDTLRYSNTNCDSLVRIVNLTVQSSSTSVTNIVICSGQNYTLPWGQVVNTTGVYRDTVRYVNSNCDSLYRIVQLRVTPLTVNSTNASICPGETYTLPWGTVVSNGGLYSDTLRSPGGCDSIISNVNLVIKPGPVVSITKSNDVNCIMGFTKLKATGGATYLWSPSVGLNNTTINDPIATPQTTITYQVKVTGANGCVNTDSIKVIVDPSGAKDGLLLPGAFSPNGDGKNDCFGVRHWGAVTKLDLQIYNRWGQLVFHTTDPSKCWDGKFNGQLQPSSVYVYLITAEGLCGNVQRKGSLLLIR